MQQLRKIDTETNVVTWFEIPVTDTPRAKKFYETILDIEMRTVQAGDKEELTFFPSDPNIVQATSGRVTGVLTNSPEAKPGAEGTLIYLNAYPEIQTVLNKVVPAGGKILTPKHLIKAGYIAIIQDTEGNRIGLHAEA
ncbi:VOC family protein [Chitinophaga deserti]|uniref:VOC family protein n=1 Tax=Chitinophaga deserti TaxID=2164099 RepID=UPI000D6B0729|nr:VOC family protein [Chitinophaga deserti]